MNDTTQTLLDFWHSCLIILLSAGVIAGSGYLLHMRIGHTPFMYAGALTGVVAGLFFCGFVVSRLRRSSRENYTQAHDRDNARLTFPRFILGLVHYGLIVGGAVLLGLLAWIGAEDYALGRPLTGPIEIILGWLVSLSIGLTAFHFGLRVFDGD
ncbi:MAG: hypothetical protein VW802_14745 [Rhodospirillaceae bacterium]|jgi:hypothetical protein